jgi:hypothetical protein
MTTGSFVDNCPNSYSNAVEGPDKDNWKRAIKEECESQQCPRHVPKVQHGSK